MNHLRRIRMDHTHSKEVELAKLAQRLQDKQAQLKNTYNIEPEPKPEINCPVCNDIGWITEATEFGSKAILCPNLCDARERNQTRRQYTIIENQHLQSVTGRNTQPLRIRLRDYQPQTDWQRQSLAVSTTYLNNDLNVALNGGASKRSLVFVGQYGSGKTYIASAIANELDIMGYNVWYIKFGEMIRRVNDCYSDSIPQTPLQVIHALQHVHVLILDDVGRNHSTGATKDTFFDILDARYDLNRPTIITTNLYPDQMGNTFDLRIQSRLQDCANWIRMDGDLRDQTEVL